MINYKKSETIYKSSLKSHVYWDTLYDFLSKIHGLFNPLFDVLSVECTSI